VRRLPLHTQDKHLKSTKSAANGAYSAAGDGIAICEVAVADDRLSFRLGPMVSDVAGQPQLAGNAAGDPSPQGPDTLAYDRQVATYVNRVLRTYSNRWTTVAQNMDNAQSSVTNDRKFHGGDLVMRDAEYYLKTRAWTASHKYAPVKLFYATGLPLAVLVWNGLKYVVDKVDPGATQSDKGVPNTPPGGIDWAVRGAIDGMADDGSQRGQARLVFVPG
jgi:hypothetical protein